jgi:hypothetical protein
MIITEELTLETLANVSEDILCVDDRYKYCPHINSDSPISLGVEELMIVTKHIATLNKSIEVLTPPGNILYPKF